jgi:hypothetical protein
VWALDEHEAFATLSVSSLRKIIERELRKPAMVRLIETKRAGPDFRHPTRVTAMLVRRRKVADLRLVRDDDPYPDVPF